MTDAQNKISRRDFLKSLSAIALASTPMATALSTFTSCSVIKENNAPLHILHTNDVHSHIDPFPPSDPRYPGLGGYARRQALIEKVRNEYGPDNVLTFECGDMFQGTPYFNFYKGHLEIKLMNKMNVDAVTIGNHEFDNGVNGLCNCIEQANFPFLSANYLFTDPRGKNLVQPYKIFHRAGLKIGVFGIGVELKGLVSPSNCNGVQYKDPIKTAQQTTNLLRSEGCNCIIALTHIGLEGTTGVNDIQLAKSTSGIDLILGGHSHTFLEKPIFVKNKTNHDVPINQVGYGGINVGLLTLQKQLDNEIQVSNAETKEIK